MSLRHTVVEPAREIPIAAEVDVLVAGGGPAGIAAAIAAAREGARTLLVERYGYLGGMVTGANVVVIMGVGDGRKNLAGGLVAEWRQRLGAMGAAQDLKNDIDYKVDNETFKWQAQEMILEAGADLLLHTQVCAPIMQEGRVAGAYVESKSGRQAILAQATVDATADADLAYRAGVPCDNDLHEVTLVMELEGVDKDRLVAYANAHPQEYQAIMAEARRISEGDGSAVVGSVRHMKGVDVTDAQALTRAEIKLRREAWEALRLLRARLPGYEQARISVTYPQFGVRQSRRIRGEYMLVDDDLVSSRHFDDGVARLGVYFPDWGPTYQLEGLAYDIPYRALVPLGVDGLLVAGRCISCDYRTCNTMRLLTPCIVTGQAAGAAAAVAVEVGCAPRAVPIPTLRQALMQQGVYLG